MANESIFLVYDRECPACHLYCVLARVRESAGELVLLNAREPHPILDEITNRGWDIDNGMVLKLHGELYYGSDAIHMLSLIGTRSGLVNRLMYRLFANRRVARALYPLLASARRILLRLLQVRPINNLRLSGKDRFRFFG